MSFRPAILYVDDEPTNLEVFKRAFGAEYLVKICLSAPEALDILARENFPLVIADQRMPEMTGIELCEKLVALRPETIRVILTAYSEPKLLLDAINRGKVHDYIVKPWRKSELKPIIEKCFQAYKERAEKMETLREKAGKAEALEREMESVFPVHDLVGSNTGLKPLMDQLERVAPTDSTVLLLGETGTGKELLARAVHQKSSRKGGPFVAVHCGALAHGVLESELFGHVKGAFTGADQNRTGSFELASGGTLFLDEAGEIPEAVQVKLLRVLQEKTIQRVGASAPVLVDFRLVAATHRDLGQEVKAGRFREDLFYRLNVVPLKLPALRERAGDIPILAGHFLSQFNQKLMRQLSFSPAALERLTTYDWPGNVRELQNVIERAVILSVGPQIESEDLNVNEDFTRIEKVDVQRMKPSSVREQIQAKEVEELKNILTLSQGNIAEAARSLGIARSTLFHRLKKYRLI